MKKPLNNLEPLSDSLLQVPIEINRYFIAAYANAFPPREFVHKRFQISNLTSCQTRYFDLIRTMSTLFNLTVVRHTPVVTFGCLWVIGRKRNVDLFIHFLERTIREVEDNTQDERDSISGMTGKLIDGNKINKTSYISHFRGNLISIFDKELREIYLLKHKHYMPKYAKIRMVAENEVMDRNFTFQYMKENRLNNLKRFKWVQIATS